MNGKILLNSWDWAAVAAFFDSLFGIAAAY